MDQEQLERKLETLEAGLRKSVAAEEFFNQSSGKLIQDLIATRVTLSIQKIAGTTFLKDHTGYVNENSWLRANQKLLADLQKLAKPETKAAIRKRMEELEEQNA